EPHVLAAGATPEAERGGVVRGEEVERVVAVGREDVTDARAAMNESIHDEAPRGVDVLPELEAGVQRIDVEIGLLREPLEDADELRGDVREREDVEGGGKGELRRIDGGEGVGQESPRRFADAGRALGVEEREPEPALPALDVGRRLAREAEMLR